MVYIGYATKSILGAMYLDRTGMYYREDRRKANSEYDLASRDAYYEV